MQKEKTWDINLRKNISLCMVASSHQQKTQVRKGDSTVHLYVLLHM